MNRPAPVDLPALISIDRWQDPFVETQGEPVASLYCEEFWLPVLGPSAMWLLRLAARRTAEGVFVVEPEVLGSHLGLGGGVTHSSPLARTLTRLVSFDCGRMGAHGGQWWLRTHLGPVPLRSLRRLPDELRRRHDALTRAVSVS